MLASIVGFFHLAAFPPAREDPLTSLMQRAAKAAGIEWDREPDLDDEIERVSRSTNTPLPGTVLSPVGH